MLNNMTFIDDLKDLVVKCTKLKPSTAKKYARELFNKYSLEDGFVDEIERIKFKKIFEDSKDFQRALITIKQGAINTKKFHIKLDKVSTVMFTEDTIHIKMDNDNVYKLEGNDFKYLKYVFREIDAYCRLW